ncbi:hypothetical protein EV184_1378 [Sinorhizobium americanum]|uniref:Uncharacterized protein n=1 Tax=Sinorhizobium americanum TaxID=194963 RepID=A0A4R2AUY6_9HYPH|nr:hypothetical protein EV184_1378 [Sinorhizobium americanum]
MNRILNAATSRSMKSKVTSRTAISPEPDPQLRGSRQSDDAPRTRGLEKGRRSERRRVSKEQIKHAMTGLHGHATTPWRPKGQLSRWNDGCGPSLLAGFDRGLHQRISIECKDGLGALTVRKTGRGLFVVVRMLRVPSKRLDAQCSDKCCLHPAPGSGVDRKVRCAKGRFDHLGRNFFHRANFIPKAGRILRVPRTLAYLWRTPKITRYLFVAPAGLGPHQPLRAAARNSRCRPARRPRRSST